MSQISKMSLHRARKICTKIMWVLALEMSIQNQSKNYSRLLGEHEMNVMLDKMRE